MIAAQLISAVQRLVQPHDLLNHCAGNMSCLVASPGTLGRWKERVDLQIEDLDIGLSQSNRSPQVEFNTSYAKQNDSCEILARCV